jgi:CubicO group peptidase (beta-lactamase class C family)
MRTLEREVASLAASSAFSGVVRVDAGGECAFELAFGLAHRAHGIPNTTDTQFAIASGVKGFTAVTVASLVADGVVELDTTARSLLGNDLPLIGDDVTVEHLLAHRSGIGDYVDEDAELDVDGYVLPVPVHTLVNTEDYLAVLGGHPAKFDPDERFSYCNSGYVVLALLAERATGLEFAELVRRRVCEPAGMTATAFLRSDELPGTAAAGYLGAGGAIRTNVLHLPVRGSGDGGIYSTAADLSAFWDALHRGDLLPTDCVAELVRPRSDVPAMASRYGLGFWLHPSSGAVFVEGSDAGVSFRSAHDPARGLTYTVASNTSGGAWPLVRLLHDRICGG